MGYFTLVHIGGAVERPLLIHDDFFPLRPLKLQAWMRSRVEKRTTSSCLASVPMTIRWVLNINFNVNH